MSELLENKINSELSSMDKRLSDLEDKITSIDSKLTQVVDAILGNSLTKEGGLLNDIVELKAEIIILKEKVRKQEEFRNRVGWTIGIIIALGLFAQFLSRIYTDMIK